jgi:Endodeoxyribonuclease RusA
MELTLRLPMPVSINRLYINEHTYKYNPKTRIKEKVPTGRRILSKDGKRVKAQIQAEARVQFEQQKDKWDYEWTKENFCYQDALVIFARRGSDDNNIYKLLNDSLEGIVYENDSRVLVRTQKIVYNPKDPHVEITLRPVEFIGIFDNKDDRDEFEARCEFGGEKGCSKYRNGKCSILKDSLLGTVREEIGDINNPYCLSFTEKK